MKGLFMPEDVESGLERIAALNLTEEKNVVVFASGSKIYALKDFDSNPILIADREGDNYVTGLCYNLSKLYDAGSYGRVYETLTDEVVKDGCSNINTLTNHHGRVLFGGADEHVMDAHTDYILETSSRPIQAIGGLDDYLYVASKTSVWRANAMDKFCRAYSTNDLLYGMCGFEDMLVMGLAMDVGNHHDCCVVDVMSGRRLVNREDCVTDVFEHKGVLYDCSGKYIFETLSSEKVFEFDHISSATSAYGRMLGGKLI